MEPSKFCDVCGSMTAAGKEALKLRNRKNPTYGTDFNKDISKILTEVRDRITAARGTLDDVAAATGWGEQIVPIIGLLTCGLGALYDVLQEVKKFEGRINNELGQNKNKLD